MKTKIAALLAPFLAFTVTAEAWRVRVDAGLEGIPEKIRMIEDIDRLCRALTDPDRRDIVPAELKVEGATKNWTSEGEITLLDPANLSRRANRYSIDVPWAMVTFGRGWEEDRKFSPYLQPGPAQKVLLSDFPSDQSVVTKFPFTYLIPETWFPDVLTIADIKGELNAVDLPPATSGISTSLRAYIRLKEKRSVGELGELLQQGDEYSQTYILSRIFMANDSAGTPILLDYIEKATTPAQMHSLALGLATACGSYYRLEPNDFPKTVKALYRFAEKYPGEAGEIRKFLNWYRSKWGR